MRKISRLGIQDMANLLTMRKKNHQHTVLLLGARAGQLFRSADFYDNLRQVSKRNFHQLSRIKQFHECYSILTNDTKLSERDLHSILQDSLKNLLVTNADACLASLIRHQYFDEILSTNIDEVLDDALAQTEMKAGRDYQVMSIGRNSLQDEKSCFCRITKVFGDVVSREYTVRERASRLENPELKSFLQKLLGKDLLIVGLDPIWDHDIPRVIPMNTKATLWFVSEDNDIMGKSPFLPDILRARHAGYILGREGSYDQFVRKLHECLYGNISPNYQSAHSQTLENIQNQVDRMANLILSIEVQLKNVITLQLGTNDQLQGLQNDHQALFGEIQQLRNELEEIKSRERDLQN